MDWGDDDDEDVDDDAHDDGIHDDDGDDGFEAATARCFPFLYFYPCW